MGFVQRALCRVKRAAGGAGGTRRQGKALSLACHS